MVRTSSNVTAPQAAIKPEKTAVDSAKDNKHSVAVRKEVKKTRYSYAKASITLYTRLLKPMFPSPVAS